MGRKNSIPKFNISTPDVRTIYLGKGLKQKVRFIQLHENFGKRILEDDIKAGAAIYMPFTEILNRKSTQYNIITAPTEEDGLRAVAYLAGVHAEEDGFCGDDIDINAYTDSICESEYSFTKEGINFEDPNETTDEGDYWAGLFDDADDEQDNEDYSESFARIPVINMCDIADLENHNRPINSGLFTMETQNNAKKPKPWWIGCDEESVCVLKRDWGWMDFDMDDVDPFEISCLKRFASNRHVYFLIINDSIREANYSITSFMLEYTANAFHVENRQDLRDSYYSGLLRYEADIHGFGFSKRVDISLLADRLSKIDSNRPCEMFKKIMEYMIHLDAPHILRSDDFDGMGLKKLVERTGCDSIKTLEGELVGMEDVKKQVNNIMNMLRYVKLRAKKGVKSSEYHNVHLFIGAPGTAKTTVAKIMAKMMQNEGLLKGTRFISVTGAQLKGAYVGQTAPKVHAIFEEHDAIFIDEAYSLICGSEFQGGIDSYSEEALAQLAVEIEEHSKDKLIIFAGYGGRIVSSKNNLMNKFLKSNPGISSRINSTIYFDSYSSQDMVNIVHGLARKKELKLSTDQDHQIADYFEMRLREDDFGNGREARMLVEQCERHIAERVAAKDPDKVTEKEIETITDEDISSAIDELKKRRCDELGVNGHGYGVIRRSA